MCSTMWSTCFNKCLKSAKLRYKSREWWYPYQPHLGTQIHRCGCSLPGLTRFAVYRCVGTNRATITITIDRLRGAQYRQKAYDSQVIFIQILQYYWCLYAIACIWQKLHLLGVFTTGIHFYHCQAITFHGGAKHARVLIGHSFYH